MRIKRSDLVIVLGLLLLLFSPFLAADAQQNKDEMVTITVPKSSLTPQQQLSQQQQEVHSWVGIGKEVGDAVNSSLQAITTQSNNFAQTNVGRITVAVVIWKIMGDQLIHILGTIVEIMIFLPIWLWSFRRMCFTKRIKTGKDTWQVVEYKWQNHDCPSPRVTHILCAIPLLGIILITAFSY